MEWAFSSSPNRVLPRASQGCRQEAGVGSHSVLPKPGSTSLFSSCFSHSPVFNVAEGKRFSFTSMTTHSLGFPFPSLLLCILLASPQGLSLLQTLQGPSVESADHHLHGLLRCPLPASCWGYYLYTNDNSVFITQSNLSPELQTPTTSLPPVAPIGCLRGITSEPHQ